MSGATTATTTTTAAAVTSSSSGATGSGGVGAGGSVTRFSILRDKVIGEGGYGTVFLAVDHHLGIQAAVKESKLVAARSMGDAAALEKALRDEYELLKKLDHPNIVRVYDLSLDANTGLARIYMEFMSLGSLRNIISRNHHFRLHEAAIRRNLGEVLKGLSYLHSNNILHRDIKCANILVGGDGSVKMSDFGTCKTVDTLGGDTQIMTAGIIGTCFFLAPECLNKNKYSRASDVWAVGCSIIEMATGNYPWAEVPSHLKAGLALACHIGNAKPPHHHPAIPGHLSSALQGICEACFDIDPHKRPSAEELLKSGYFTDTELPSDAENLQDFKAAWEAAVHDSKILPSDDANKKNVDGGDSQLTFGAAHTRYTDTDASSSSGPSMPKTDSGAVFTFMASGRIPVSGSFPSTERTSDEGGDGSSSYLSSNRGGNSHGGIGGSNALMMGGEDFMLPSPPPLPSIDKLSRTDKHHSSLEQQQPLHEPQQQQQQQQRFIIYKDECLGHGAYRLCYRAFDIELGMYVVALENTAGSTLQGYSDLRKAFNETAVMRKDYELLSQCQHPNLLRAVSFSFDADTGAFQTFMEWMPAGSIDSVMKFTGRRLHESAIRRHLHGVLRGLAYLNSQGIVHRNIKCGNLLIGGSGEIKLSSLGLCQRGGHEEDEEGNTVVGTPSHLAPETLMGQGYTHASDIWAVGCSVVEMATAAPPWASAMSAGGGLCNPIMLMYHIASVPGRHPDLPTHLSPALRHILKRCFATEAKDRPTAMELLQLPYFTAHRPPLVTMATATTTTTTSEEEEDPNDATMESMEAYHHQQQELATGGKKKDQDDKSESVLWDIDSQLNTPLQSQSSGASTVVVDEE